MQAHASLIAALRVGRNCLSVESDPVFFIHSKINVIEGGIVVPAMWGRLGEPSRLDYWSTKGLWREWGFLVLP